MRRFVKVARNRFTIEATRNSWVIRRDGEILADRSENEYLQRWAQEVLHALGLTVTGLSYSVVDAKWVVQVEDPDRDPVVRDGDASIRPPA